MLTASETDAGTVLAYKQSKKRAKYAAPDTEPDGPVFNPLEWALKYAAAGLPVFPLAPGTKVPLKGSHGHKDATTDPELIREWWTANPNCNIGLPTGSASGVDVLDIDDRPDEGKDGPASLIKFIDEHGEFPVTVRHKTPSGGYQYFYKATGRTKQAIGFLPGLDVKGEDNYVVVPPSIKNGKHYTWEVEPFGVELEPFPDGIFLASQTKPEDEAERGDPLVEDSALWTDAEKERLIAKHCDGPAKGDFIDNAAFDLACDVRDRATKATALSMGTEVLARMNVTLPKGCKPLTLKKWGEKVGSAYTKPPRKIAEEMLFDGSCGDIFNARRFSSRYSDVVRYCRKLGGFFMWNGTVYEADPREKLIGLARKLVDGFYAEVGLYSDKRPENGDPKAKSPRQHFLSHIAASSRRNRLNDMVELSKSFPNMQAEPSEFDADPMDLNCRNGIVNLRTGILRPHTKGDLVTKVCAVAYDPDAKCPTFDAFLERIQPDEEMRSFLQRAIGYSATGSCKEEVFFECWGTGQNGKTKLIGAIQYVLGKGEYSRSFPVEMILKKKNEPMPYDLAELRGMRFTPTSEPPADRGLDEASVKKLTGGDEQNACKKYCPPFTFEPMFSIWILTNKRISIKSTDVAMWRRVRLVPFEVTIPLAEQDMDLAEKLEADAAGILAWIVRGAMEWNRIGLAAPEKVLMATATYRTEQDEVARFLEAETDRKKLKSISKELLYGLYTNFSDDPLTKNAFGGRMREMGFREVKVDGSRHWSGLYQKVIYED